jgi:hypothetical protein
MKIELKNKTTKYTFALAILTSSMLISGCTNINSETTEKQTFIEKTQTTNKIPEVYYPSVTFPSTKTNNKPTEALEKPETILAAIRLVETHNNPRMVGNLGERGAYQFRYTTWKQHTNNSFKQAHNPKEANKIAKLHLNWIKTTLKKNGKPANNYNIALAWNAGVNAVVTNRINRNSKDYAQRVSNITQDIEKS